MISIKNFTARIGNQLFQLANALSYGKRYSVSVAIPKWEYSSLFVGDFTPVIDKDPQKLLWSEPEFSYTPIPEGATLLEGYYQSEKYFLDNIEEIHKIFSFKQEVVDR